MIQVSIAMETVVKDETTIDALPSEILIKIFEQMDRDTLKSSALVCNRFVAILLCFLQLFG